MVTKDTVTPELLLSARKTLYVLYNVVMAPIPGFSHQHAHQGFALSRTSPFIGHLSQVVTEAVLSEFFNSVGLSSYSCRLCRLYIWSADGTGT